MPPRRRTAKAPKPKVAPKVATPTTKCRLVELGAEVQLAIIEQVDSLGLVQLQQTCKHFHKLLKTSDKAIEFWSQRLRHQSAVHNLFWPSFKDLETVKDFQTAVTAGPRFVRAYDNAAKSGVLPSTTSNIEIDGDIGDSPAHLVAGGRYVVLLEYQRILVIDLQADTDEEEEQIACTYATERPLDVPDGCVWVAENGKKVYILHQYTSPMKQRVRSRDPCKSTVTSFTLLELSLGEDGQLSLKEKVQLPVVHWAESLHVHPVLDGCIAFVDDVMGVTFVWNPSESEYAALRVGCMGSETRENISNVFSVDSFIFFANDEGVQAVEVPYFQELEEDESVIMSDLKARAMSSYSASLDTSAPSVAERRIVSSGSPGHPIVYDLIAKDRKGDTLEVHRHVLHFDPDSPDDIELKTIEISKCTLDSDAGRLSARRQMLCDGRIATLWVPQDEHAYGAPEAAYISVSPSASHGHFSKSKAVKSKFDVARFYEGGDDIYEFGFCPASGIAVGLKESSIEVYNFIDRDDE